MISLLLLCGLFLALSLLLDGLLKVSIVVHLYPFCPSYAGTSAGAKLEIRSRAGGETKALVGLAKRFGAFGMATKRANMAPVTRPVWALATPFALLLGMLLLGSLRAQNIVIENLTHLNTAASEISPALYGDQLVYAFQPPNGRIDQRSKTIFYELYVGSKLPNARKKPKPFSIELNPAFHEGALSFSPDLKQVFYTRTHLTQGVLSGQKKAALGIYYAYQGQYAWEGARPLNFNLEGYSCMHPSLSPDGNRLFFASDRPEGYGGLDIYFCEWNKQKKDWGPPINLGPEVNTGKNEAYPFVHDSGQLFFASNGHAGLGGMDIFTIDLSGRIWSDVYNLPAPYNSPSDDFGFVLESSAKEGYLSSNRPGGVGSDDLYRFTAPQGLDNFTGTPQRRVLLSVYDGGTSRQLFGAEIWLTAINTNQEQAFLPQLLSHPDGAFRLKAGKAFDRSIAKTQRYVSDLEGKVDLLLKEGQHYRLLIHKSGFHPEEATFEYSAQGASRPLEFVLKPDNCLLVTGRLLSADSGSPLPGVALSFYPTDCDQPAVKTSTQPDGSYVCCIPKGCNYQVVAQKTAYRESRSALGTVRARADRLTVDLKMSAIDPRSEDILLRVGQTLVLENIAYEEERYTPILSSKTDELELLLNLLLSRPGLSIRLENHTETKGPETYNKELSYKRVDALQAYLVNAGIDPSRIQIAAYGAEVPKNGCSGQSDCTDLEHRKNRRTEVKILSLDAG